MWMVRIALIAVVAATGVAQVRPFEVRGPAAVVRAREGRIELVALRDRGEEVRVGWLERVWIRTAEEQEAVPLEFGEVQAKGGVARLEAGEHRGHRVRLELRVAEGSRVAVRLWDEVGLGSPLVELSVEYRLAQAVADRAGPGMLGEGPMPDLGVALPFGLLQGGQIGLGLVADPELPNRQRRIPTALGMAGEPGAAIRHGWRAIRRNDQLGSDPAGADVSGMRLELAHELALITEASPGTTARELADECWRKAALPGPGPLGERGIAVRLAAARQPFAERWRSYTYGGRKFEAPLGRDAATGATAASFQLDHASATTAFALAARGGDEVARARALTELLLQAPARGGLAPARLVAPTDGVLRWEPVAGAPGELRAADAAWSGLWLLAIGELLAEPRARILDHCRRTAQFLVQNHRADGSIPATFETTWLQPGGAAQSLDEQATCVRFLLDYAAATGDAEAERAGLRSFAHLAGRAAGGLPDRIGALARIALAASAAARFPAVPEPWPVARRALDALAERQAIWTPGWIDADLRGSLADRGDDLRWSQPEQALAALAWLEAYRAGARPQDLTRGAAALRAAVAALPQAGWRAELPSLPIPAEDVESSLALVEAAVALARRIAGDAIVDLRSRTAQGIDAVWFEQLVIGDGELRFDFLTHCAEPRAMQVRILGADDRRPLAIVANGVALPPRSAAELASGLALVPRRVAAVHCAPPREIAARGIRHPRAIVRAADAAAVSISAEIRRNAVPLAELRLLPLDGSEIWAADPRAPLPDGLLRAGDRITMRLWIDEDGRRTVLPRSGEFELAVGDWSCLDPGHDDELELRDAGTSRRRRASDPLSSGRWVPPGTSVTYAIPVAAGATRLELEFALRGQVRIESGELRLHEDEADSEAMRTIPVALADHRLWPQNRLPIRFTALGGGGLLLSRIRFAAAGASAPAAGPGRTERGEAAAAAVAVRVIPLALADAPLRASPAELENALLGRTPYTLTPEPQPRRTSGSVAQLVQAFSGGTTRIDARIEAPLELPVLAADLADAPPARAQELIAAVAERIRLAPHEVGLVVHSERIGPIAAGGGRFVFVPERSDDGSFVATGRLLRAVLAARFDLPDRSTPEHGRFGSLALNADGDGHAPAGLLGVDLARLGWADVVQLDPRRAGPDGLDIELAPLQAARAIYRLPLDELHGRGDLFLEARAADVADPIRAGAGLLAYWRLPVPATIARAGATPARVSWLRLSGVLPLLDVPFTPGDDGDLLRRATRLDGDSSPSLASPHGDAPWRIHGLTQRADGGWQARITYEAEDLLDDCSGASIATANGARPVLPGAAGDPQAAVTTGPPRFELALHEPGELRAWFTPPRADAASRLFARVRTLHGGGELAFEDGRRRIASLPLGAGDPRVLIADWPVRDTLTLVLLATEPDTKIALEQLLVVPRAAGSIPLQSFPATGTLRMQDGAWYAATVRVPVTAGTGAATILPIALPAERTLLRLGIGQTWDTSPAAAPLRLTAVARSPDGSWQQELITTELPPRSDAPLPLALLLCEIRPPPGRKAAFLELQLRGPEGAAAHLTTVSVGR